MLERVKTATSSRSANNKTKCDLKKILTKWSNINKGCKKQVNLPLLYAASNWVLAMPTVLLIFKSTWILLKEMENKKS